MDTHKRQRAALEGVNMTMTGRELKTIRKEAGLTQQALGNMAGTSLRAIAKYEAGEIDLGRIEVRTAIKLAAALKIPVERFAET